MTTHTPDECAAVRPGLDPYLQGEPDGREAVARHLEACAACSRELEDLRRLKGALRSALGGGPPAPALLRDQVRARLAQDVAASSAPRRAWPSWRPLAAAAALAVAVSGVWVASRSGAPPATVRSDAAAPEFMKVALAHDVHCASAVPEPDEPQTLEGLEARLGPELEGLVAGVAGRLPAGMRLVDAHRCRFGGRRFTHIVLRNGAGRASVLVTDREGLDVRREGSVEVLSVGGTDVFRVRADGSDLSAFATERSVVYVVSGTRAIDSFALAAALYPATSAA